MQQISDNISVYKKNKFQICIAVILAALSIVWAILLVSAIYFGSVFTNNIVDTVLKSIYINSYILPIALSLFIVSAILATLSKHYNKMNIHYIAKPLATFMLVLMASKALVSSNTVFVLLVVLGIVLSVIGDVFMMFDEKNICFTGGLVSFLTVHFVYIIFFFMLDKTINLASILLIIPLIISGSILMYLFRDGLKKEFFSIFAYLIIISVMLWRSYVIAFNDFNILSILLAIGTTLFYSSDATIAYERFVRKLKYGQLALLLLYFAAQLIITMYVLKI